MKVKNFKRFIVMVMCVLMCASMPMVAFAAETEINTVSSQYTTLSTTIPAKSTVTLDIGSRSAGNTTVTFVTACSSTNGTVSWKLLRSGIKVDSDDVGVNDMVYRGIYYSGGTYTIELTNSASSTVTIYIMDI